MDARGDPGRTRLWLVLVGSAVATVAVHVAVLPSYLPEGFTAALPYLLVGWASFGLVFYVLGRAFGETRGLPTMRSADAGVALFLGSVVLAGLLDTVGITVETAPIVHALPAVGVYGGLALAGWGIGERSRVIDRIADDGG